MPYWPSSRVGAVPQPTAKPKQSTKRSERMGRQKGITMEDLKKQTALRLAQEQNRQGKGGQSLTQGGSFHGNSTTRTSQQSSANTPPRTTHSVSTTPRANAQPTRQNLRTTPDAPSPFPSQMASVGLPRNDARMDLSPYGFERSSSLGQRSGPPSSHRPQPISTNRTELDQSKSQHGPHLETSSTTSSSSSMQQQKSKLPHGLTVQELKEMTKARLQAEAACKNGPMEGGPQGQVGHTASEPLPPPHDRQPPSIVVTTAPTSVARAQVLRAVSPAPPGFSPRDAQQNWPGSSERLENWETLSVGGPGNVAVAPPSDVYLMVPGQASVSSDLDSNRCSATTMPSRMGSSFNEDAPSLLNSGRTAFSDPSNSGAFRAGSVRERTFSSDAHLSNMFMQPALSVRERAFSSDNHHAGHFPHGSNMLLQRPSTSVPNFSPSPAVGNRGRTSSTTSLPAISHTADEFGMESVGPGLVGGSSATIGSRRFSSQFGAVREDAPLTTPGLADVFRVSSFDNPSPVMSSPHNNTSHGLSSIYHNEADSLSVAGLAGSQATDNRIRAATWSEPGSLFDSVNDLSDDLVSILKLSGAEDNNHFLSSM